MYNYNNTEKKPVIYKIIIILSGIIIGFILIKLLIFSYKIKENSMSPGLKKGDLVFAFKHTTPSKGDVIIFKSPLQPDKILIKRIVAAAGDVVEIKNNTVLINKKKYLKYNHNKKSKEQIKTIINNQKITIPNNNYFVLSDNNIYRFDSREFGIIKNDSIIGVIFLGI